MNDIIPYLWVFVTGMFVGVYLNKYFASMRELKKRNKAIDDIIDVNPGLTDRHLRD